MKPRPPEHPGFLVRLPLRHRTDEMLAYHARDPDGPAERLRDGTLLKAFVFEGKPMVLKMTICEGGVWCEPNVGRKPPDPEFAARVEGAAARMLGLGSDVEGFEARARRSPDVKRLVSGRLGLRVPLAPEPFEAMAWAILGQQINIAFAVSLRRELIVLAGRKVPGCALLAHPEAADVAQLRLEDLTARRFSRSKAEYLIGAARAVADGSLPLGRLAGVPAEAAAEALGAIRGIGPWSRNYIMMRGLGFADCVPVGDTGLSSGLQRFYALDHRPDAKETGTLMEPFSPHRSLATFHVWAYNRSAAG